MIGQRGPFPTPRQAPHSTFQDVQDWFFRKRMIKEELPLSRLIDTHYADAAAKALSPFVLANKSSTLAGCR